MCPYFMSKNAAEVADIVLLPYNYIIDRDAREGNSLDLNVGDKYFEIECTRRKYLSFCFVFSE